MKLLTGILSFFCLAALLACNERGKNPLEEFHRINNSLDSTNKAFRSKDQVLLQQIDSLYQADPDKHGRKYRIAHEAGKANTEFISYIENMKRELIIATSKSDTIGQVQASYDVSTEIMIKQGKASELKAKMEEHRKVLASYCEGKECKDLLETQLRGDGLQTADGTLPWESLFEDMPLAATITNLSKIQADAKNAYIDVLQSLINNK